MCVCVCVCVCVCARTRKCRCSCVANTVLIPAFYPSSKLKLNISALAKISTDELIKIIIWLSSKITKLLIYYESIDHKLFTYQHLQNPKLRMYSWKKSLARLKYIYKFNYIYIYYSRINWIPYIRYHINKMLLNSSQQTNMHNK